MSESFDLPCNSSHLAGQVALVTGATSGLGRRFALVLARCGARVAVTGRRVERLEVLSKEIREGGGECVPIRLDMTDTDSILSVVEEAESQLGTVTTLVNNAGIPDAQRAHKMSVKLIDDVFDTNLRGPFILSCEVARRLIEKKKPGRMVNISSVSASVYDGNGAALYSVTKAGIARMSETLAIEWARNRINVNCIAPGVFASEMVDGMLERMGDLRKVFPRGRVGDAAQLDSTLIYLVSPASECVTGAVIRVDDGQFPH